MSLRPTTLSTSSDFTQTVDSIQIEHDTVDSTKASDPIGVKVDERARVHDQVFMVTRN